jgi:hypothetical protein
VLDTVISVYAAHERDHRVKPGDDALWRKMRWPG